MSHYYPPPPGVDRRANASHYPPPPAPPNYGGGASSGDSYRPPPPAYLPPPPPAGYDSYDRNNRSDRGDRADRYSRDDRDGRGDRYEPSRRYDRPRSPPRAQGSFQFRGSDSSRPPQGDFDFRVDKPNGVGDSYNSYRPADSRARLDPPRGPAKRPYQDRPSQSYGNRGRGRGGYAGRRPWKPFVAADRAILHTTENDKPKEDFADAENGIVYRSIDQLSDSDEAEMDMSDSDDESRQPTNKRARTGANGVDDGDDAPKWSNPEPYSALPPVDDTDKKRKDVVQLIRKARVQPATGSRTSLPADDGDFIRCDSPSDDEEAEDEEEFIDPLTYNRGASGAQGVPGAPTGPRAIDASQAVTVTTSAPSQVAVPKTQPALATVNAEKRVPPADLARYSDLGTRKRTHDDVLKLPSHARLKPPPGKPAGGSLVEEWRNKKNENPCPWVVVPVSEAQANVRCVKRYNISLAKS